MFSKDNLTITNLTKGRLPSLPFVKMKKKILGKNYDLSLVFAEKKEMETLNLRFRKIGSPTDVLSFPLSKCLGEIFICAEIADKRAVEFNRTKNNFIAYLFIHGCVHLLGFKHGDKMGKLEEKYRKIFKI